MFSGATTVAAYDCAMAADGLVDMPRTPTIVFLIIANVSIILGPVLLVHRLRVDLTVAQTRLAVQAWHFERLGAQLIGAPAGTPTT